MQKAPQVITSLSQGQLERLNMSEAQRSSMNEDELIMVSLRKSASAPGLGSSGVKKSHTNLPQQVDTMLFGSQKYSFGKMEHGLGKYLVPRKSPRSSYLNVKDTPGAGSYDMDTNCGSDRVFVRNPRYSFGLSGTERDPMVKRFTPYSQVRGMSYHDNPGPGRYFGPESDRVERFGGEKSSLQHAQPAWTMTYKRQPSKGYHWEPTPGADRYFIERDYTDNLNNRRRFPHYGIGTQKRSAESLINKVSTTAVGGPGRYKHAVSLVTQFPGKQKDKSRSLTNQDDHFRKAQLH